MMVVAMMNDSDFLEVDNDYDTQEELARKRQLPVPPMPRKGGVIARSEDNVSGADHIPGKMTDNSKQTKTCEVAGPTGHTGV